VADRWQGLAGSRGWRSTRKRSRSAGCCDLHKGRMGAHHVGSTQTPEARHNRRSQVQILPATIENGRSGQIAYTTGLLLVMAAFNGSLMVEPIGVLSVHWWDTMSSVAGRDTFGRGPRFLCIAGTSAWAILEDHVTVSQHRRTTGHWRKTALTPALASRDGSGSSGRTLAPEPPMSTITTQRSQRSRRTALDQSGPHRGLRACSRDEGPDDREHETPTEDRGLPGGC